LKAEILITKSAKIRREKRSLLNKVLNFNLKCFAMTIFFID